MLKDLYAVSKLSTITFELGGVAASVERTAREMAVSILGEFRTRRAKPDEMDKIYEMGRDVWAEGSDRAEYLAACRTSTKYSKGTWYVLEDADAKPVSSLITYKLDQVNGRRQSASVPSLRTRFFAAVDTRPSCFMRS
ncbi:MAG: hypothetical protein HC888_06325 [Candidatus Competibacteraceae bacterium]|nr:hypothetical protein [Candidatus Competibacteraceae bacterium]